MISTYMRVKLKNIGYFITRRVLIIVCLLLCLSYCTKKETNTGRVKDQTINPKSQKAPATKPLLLKQIVENYNKQYGKYIYYCIWSDMESQMIDCVWVFYKFKPDSIFKIMLDFNKFNKVDLPKHKPKLNDFDGIYIDKVKESIVCKKHLILVKQRYRKINWIERRKYKDKLIEEGNKRRDSTIKYNFEQGRKK